MPHPLLSFRILSVLCLKLCLCLALPSLAPAENLPRVIALHAGIAEIILALGRGDALIARTATDEALLPHLPSIGTHLRPNVEAIVALRPDHVLYLDGTPIGDALGLLQSAGIPTTALPGNSLEDLFAALTSLGQLLNAQEEAAAHIQRLKDGFAALQRHNLSHRPRVLVELRYPNLLVSGTGSLVQSLIQAAGGQNAIQAPDKVVRISEEELLRAAPEVCIILRGPMHPSPVPYSQRGKVFAALPCTYKGRVYEADQAAFSRPTPRVLEAAQMLAGWIQAADAQEMP